MTSAGKHVYAPDQRVYPGQVLEEMIADKDMSARELARRCGRSAKLMAEILSGKAPVEPETALQFERVLDVPASLWMNIEAAYRLHLASEQEDERLEEFSSWASAFPIKELETRGYVSMTEGSSDTVRKLLQFFGAGSVSACNERFDELLSVSFRHSPSFLSAKPALTAWLRMGEIQAGRLSCDDYDRARFMEQLKQIRSLTSKPIDKAIQEISTRCCMAGVAFVIVKPLKGVSLSGVSRWLTPRKALIQQTLRHMSDDHFWFTFYHEAAHLLLHSRKSVFVEGKGTDTSSPEEQEANEWASNFLLPQASLDKFIGRGSFSEGDVRAFAYEHGVAPGIVVGQLQNRGAIKFGGPLERLKQRFQWVAKG